MKRSSLSMNVRYKFQAPPPHMSFVLFLRMLLIEQNREGFGRMGR